MRNKTLKKKMLPFLLIALCLIASKPPIHLPSPQKSKPAQVMPLSDMEEDGAIKDE